MTPVSETNAQPPQLFLLFIVFLLDPYLCEQGFHLRGVFPDRGVRYRPLPAMHKIEEALAARSSQRAPIRNDQPTACVLCQEVHCFTVMATDIIVDPGRKLQIEIGVMHLFFGDGDVHVRNNLVVGLLLQLEFRILKQVGVDDVPGEVNGDGLLLGCVRVAHQALAHLLRRWHVSLLSLGPVLSHPGTRSCADGAFWSTGSSGSTSPVGVHRTLASHCHKAKQRDEAHTEKPLNCSSIHMSPPSADYSLPSHYYNEDGPVLLNGFRDDSFLRGAAAPEMKKPTGWGAGGRVVLFMVEVARVELASKYVKYSATTGLVGCYTLRSAGCLLYTSDAADDLLCVDL